MMAKVMMQDAMAATVAIGSYYEAVTSSGSLRLVILSGDPARHAVDAAVALDDCAALLDELDAWMGDALEWRWCRSPQVVSGARATLNWSDPLNGGPSCRIEMPWAMLRALPAPAAALQSRFSWSHVPVVLSIARFDLDPEESLALEPGGAVVLPDSFSPDWRGRLRAVDEPAGSGVPVSLACVARPRVLPMSAEGGPESGPGRYEVSLMGPSLLQADRLAGWSTQDLELSNVGVRMWRCNSDEGPAECLAAGQLIPWSSGFALVIESAGEPRTPSGRCAS